MQTTRRKFIGSLLVSTAYGATVASSAESNQNPTYLAGLKNFKETIARLPRKSGLRIKKIETYTVDTNLCFVKVTADDGSFGYGQVSPFDADITATILHRKIAPFVLGADPYDFDTISDTCIEANYKYPWSFICRALCGVDTALWDLRGRRENKSVCELLGSKPRRLPVYGSSMSRTIKPEDEARRLVQLRDSSGFKAFKIRIGKVCGHNQDEWEGRTEALVPTVRKAIGEKIGLLADANSCYTPEKAIEVGRMLEQYGVEHFEEPCPYWELEWTAQVSAALKVPVAGGKQDNDLAQWRRMIKMKAVDIAQPDVCYVGGLTRALRVAIMAAEAGLPCVPHSANLSMVMIFTLHLFAAIPNAGKYVEFTIEQNKWTENIYQPSLKVVEGSVPVPSEPGWGILINTDLLQKAQYKLSEKS
jgi:L-alanine-DL-glutamate epimerase-like enolase superfamily enzyme